MGATSGPLPYSDREEDICTTVSRSEQSDDKLADDSKGDENDGIGTVRGQKQSEDGFSFPAIFFLGRFFFLGQRRIR